MALSTFAELVAHARKVSLVGTFTRNGETSADPLTGLIGYFDATEEGWPAITGLPTTAVAPSYTTDSAKSIRHPVHSSGGLYLANVSSMQSTTDEIGHGLLIDILSYQGGLTTSVSTLQTTNLPTAALTRYTDGVGVKMAIVCYVGANSTDHTITTKYTNQAGTSGRTSVMPVFNTPSTGGVMLLPTEGSDTGVRSVESVQLSAAAGSGTYGVMLYKPILMTRSVLGVCDFSQIAGWNTPINSAAVLTFLPFYDSVTNNINLSNLFQFFVA